MKPGSVVPALLFCSAIVAYPVGAYSQAVDSSIVALWHFDEQSGGVAYDASLYHNHAMAFGTTIVPGHLGNAREFDGINDYLSVPSGESLDFNPSTSFTIEAWFSSLGTGVQEIVRRGLAPAPGYFLRLFNGYVQGQIGNREDGYPPDTLLTITSTNLYNDGQWHHATFVRDRERAKLFLYVDSVQAAAPVDDNFPIPLVDYNVLEIGRWGALGGVEYFRGRIDEIQITRLALHPVPGRKIGVSPSAIDFGRVVVGDTASATLRIANLGFSDTLQVMSMQTSNPSFSTEGPPFVLPPGETYSVNVVYVPAYGEPDIGTIAIASNDLQHPVIGVSLKGMGISLTSLPTISSVLDIPNDQGKQVRVIWFRSAYDGVNDSLLVTSYGLWRRVNDRSSLPIGTSRGARMLNENGHTYAVLNSELWDFIVEIPAVRFRQYAYVAPTLFDSTRRDGMHWSVFTVSAHTSSGQFFFSTPDSGYSLDNIAPDPPINLTARLLNKNVLLSWGVPVARDIDHFSVFRGSYSNFAPSEETCIGMSNTNSFLDTNLGGKTLYYYKVATYDSSWNQSEFSNEIAVILTGVGDRETLPQQFQLYQNHPNPFNPITHIRYDVPKDTRVTIRIYDAVGRVVATLVDGRKAPGSYSVAWEPKLISSGVYWCQMVAGDFAQNIKVVYMK
jgi:hypothetical protein